MNKKASSQNYYTVLGVTKGASTEEIKGAYKKLALVTYNKDKEMAP